MQPAAPKNAVPPAQTRKKFFTIITKFGTVRFRRQRLRNAKTGKTLTPSAVLWSTSQNRHITPHAAESACEASQAVSYRKAAKQLKENVGEAHFLSASTVWNKKQEKGKDLAQQQNDFVQQVFLQQEVSPPYGVPGSTGKCHVEPETIQLQMDEVKTKSQEDGKKWNLTYTATLETADKRCFYLAAENSTQLIQQVLAYCTVLRLYLGKRLEVISDGASWIGDWVSTLQEVPVEHVLCWYHLCERLYQSLGSLGWSKERRRGVQREILGHLWRGRTAEAVWILWGLRSSARVPERINDLIGYLLRKRRMIVDYEERRGRGLWVASTRVEKWNDLSVADRCKHRGMSWTGKGVLSVALYAAAQKYKAGVEQVLSSETEIHTSL